MEKKNHFLAFNGHFDSIWKLFFVHCTHIDLTVNEFNTTDGSVTYTQKST